MLNKKIRKVMASVMAVALLAGSVSTPAENVFAGEVLGETGFENKHLPWRGFEIAPANQNISVEDGQLRVEILNPTGEDREKWDLRTEYRNINFKKGHEYTVSFKAKSKRSGFQLCAHIGNVRGDEEYFVLNGDKMEMGPHMGGQWGKAAVLEPEYQTFSGTFIPTEDIEGAVWTFQYARGTVYEGNAQSGDEIWFDDMSIICETCEDCNYKVSSIFPPSVVNRERSAHTDPETYAPDGKLINFISVNQLGYYPGLKKVAVLADNKGDVFSMTSSIDLTESSYEFEVCDAATDEVKFKGVSGEAIQDEDSGDTVFKLDFTEFNEPGKYYIKVGEWRSFEFEINDSIYSVSGKNMLTDAMNYFYQNRSGIDIEEKYITSGEKAALAHQASHEVDEAYIQIKNSSSYSYYDSQDASKDNASSVIEASGGWYMIGQNYTKQVLVGGMSVWTLQNMYERAVQTESGRDKFADGSGTVVIPESGNIEVPAAGMNVTEFFNSLFSKVKEPEITQPTASISYDDVKTYYEVGETVTPKYTTTFTPGSYEFGPSDTGVTVSSYTISDTNGNSATTASGTLPSFIVEDDTKYNITATIAYTDGVKANNNLNQESNSYIESGSITKVTSYVRGYRAAFAGMDSTTGTITSDLIRNLDVAWNYNSSKTITLDASTADVTPVRFIVAIPANSTRAGISKVEMPKSQYANCTADYKLQETNVLVKGANDAEAVEYKVWVYAPAKIGAEEVHEITMN